MLYKILSGKEKNNMRYIMRKICLFPVMIAVMVFTGCGQKKNEDPVTVTLWHVYGGQTESPLNDLIDELIIILTIFR